MLLPVMCAVDAGFMLAHHNLSAAVGWLVAATYSFAFFSREK